MIDREPGVGTEGEGAREQIMGTKIFAFPVRGRRWCFSALVPDVPAGKYSSVVTISQLWERLQSLPQFTDRAELIESFASAKLFDSQHRCKRIGLNSELNPSEVSGVGCIALARTC